MRDISDPVVDIVNYIISFILNSFSLLDQIRFAGITLLDFIVVVAILSAVLPIIFTLVRVNVRSAHREVRAARRNERNKSSNGDE